MLLGTIDHVYATITVLRTGWKAHSYALNNTMPYSSYGLYRGGIQKLILKIYLLITTIYTFGIGYLSEGGCY